MIATGLQKLRAVLLSVAAIAVLATSTASAQQSDPVVRGVEVSGLKRVDKQSVRSKIYTQVGKPLNRARLTEDVKRIYRMNFFEDVQVGYKEHPDGGIILVFHVVERPTVIAIRFAIEGDAVDEDEVKKVVDLKRFAILDEAAIRYNLQKIEDLYVDEGHFLVETDYDLKPAPNNGVIVTLKVDQGRKVEVRHVNIVGNKMVPSDEIKGVLATREGGYFSFLTQSGQFKREFFEQDIQRIQLLYLTKGHIQVRVSDPIVTISPDKRWMSIVIRVEEGPRYTMGEIDVAMAEETGPDGQPVEEEWLIPKERLLDRVKLGKGDVFDYQQLQKDIQNLGDAYRDLGYANTTVTYEHKLDPESRIVDFTFKVQKGELVYFRRIEVRGNTTTRDKVIRRELKINEGELYSSTKMRRSQARVGVLGFFEKVEIKPQPTDRPDRMDVVVEVKEKQTGTFQVGAGFSSLESFIVTAQISKDNFLGRGQRLSAQATLSFLRQLFSVSFFEPYFFDTPITFAFDVFNFQEDFVDFDRTRTGGNISWGYRLTDDFSLSLTYTLEDVDAELRTTDIDIKSLRQSGLTSSLRLTAALDTRNNRLFPSEGTYTTLSAEVASQYLGSENEFVRLIARNRLYFPLPAEMVFKTNVTLGWVFNPNEWGNIPLFERFFVGGIYTVRGFERNSIGERLYLTSLPDGSLNDITIGGDREFIFNAELEIPLLAEVGIRGVLFFDAGTAWGVREDIDLTKIRTSVGFGFRWQSPVGPLRFEWGIPLDPRPDEEPIVFEFTIGNSF